MNLESTSNDLTSETRNTLTATETLPSTDLKIFENRLNSFNSSWPLNWLSPTSLASAGFFYFNIGDQVKCAFCGGIIGQWEIDDSPIEEHRKFFPECPVVQENSQADVIQEESGIQSVRTPKSPEFSTLDSRLRSYATWDSTIQDPRTL